MEIPEQHGNERALPGPIRPRHTHDFTAGDLECQVIERPDGWPPDHPKGFDDISAVDQWPTLAHDPQ